MRIGITRQSLLISRDRRPRPAIEFLEPRALLAAHIAGSSVVYPTIQAAVDAAAPNAIITVDPGVYPELVGINEPLTIRGAMWGVDPRGGTRQDSSKESIVTGESVGSAVSSAFYIAANDVTIDGFTVQGNTSEGMYGAGIVIGPNKSGTHILNNVVQNNIAGLYLSNASSTDAALIQHNIFRYNNNPGANGGRGIYSDGSVSGGTLQNVTIDGNFFLSNYGSTGTTTLEAAVGLESLGGVQTNIRVTNNVMEGNGKAVLAYNASNLTITGNVITTIRDQWSGALRFEGGVTNVTIQSNTIYDNTGPAVHIDTKTLATLSSGFVITNNNLYGNSSAYGNPAASVIIGAGTYSGTADVRSNWWGASTGPSGDETGGGDGLSANGNDVLYSPWSTTPVVSEDTPFDGVPIGTGVLIQAENFDQGGPGVAYLTGRTTNPGNVYRSTGVVVVADADVDQGYKIGDTTAGQWYAYTINVAQAGSYRIDYRLASAQTTGGHFHFEIDGVNITGTLTAPNTGSWTTYQTLCGAAFSLTAGTHVLKLVMDAPGSGGAVADFNWMQITPAAMPLVPTGLSLTPASSTELDLSWASSDATVTGFQILRQTAGGAFVQIATLGAAVRSYADTGLETNTGYGYEVIAINGSGSSLIAGPVTATTPIPPGAPTNFAESSATTTSITLAWTAPAGATGYQLYRQISGGSATLVATLDSGVTSYVDSPLTAATTYQYTLTASNISGTGGSANADASTKCVPPASISAVASTGQIVLTWAGVVGASSYNIYRGTTAAGESATPIAQGISSTGYIDPGLAGGSTYFYVVRAVNAAGTSAASGEASAQTPSIAPTAPTVSIAVGVGQIMLTWSGGANATSFNVYRATQAGGEATGLLASNIADGSYIDGRVQPGTNYYYVVTAVNNVGESSFSAEVYATASIVPPVAPTDVVATAATNRITLTWNSVDGATSYLVYRGTSTGGESATPITVNGTSFVDNGVDAGNSYFYQVAAANLAGSSDPSAEASATIAKALPLTVTTSSVLPAAVIAGQAKPIAQTLTFINSSKSAFIETLTTRWYLSPTASMDASAIALPGTIRKTIRLKAGARVAVTTRLTGIPKNIGTGSYYLIAQTMDAAGDVSTVTSARTISIAAPEVSLQAAFSAAPRSAISDKPLDVSIRISNLGNVSAIGALPIELAVSDAGGNVLQSLSIKHEIRIGAGGNAMIRMSMKLAASLPSQINMNVTLSPMGVIAYATSDPLLLSASLSIITRSAKR